MYCHRSSYQEVSGGWDPINWFNPATFFCPKPGPGFPTSLVENTRKFVKQCEICQRQNKKAKTTVPELNSVSIGQRVWEKIGIDLTKPGPGFPTSYVVVFFVFIEFS
jgi:hypothetical protein